MTKQISFTWTGRACGVNNRYCNRSYNLTPQYRKFVADLAMACRLQNPGIYLDGELALTIEMIIDWRRDSDSLLKPLFDAIQHSGVIGDDRQIKSYAVRVREKARGAMDEITVKGK